MRSNKGKNCPQLERAIAAKPDLNNNSQNLNQFLVGYSIRINFKLICD